MNESDVYKIKMLLVIAITEQSFKPTATLSSDFTKHILHSFGLILTLWDILITPVP